MKYLLSLCLALTASAAPELVIARHEGQFGPSLIGLIGNPNRIPSTFGVWEAQPGEVNNLYLVHPEQSRPVRLMRFNLEVVNLGDAPFTVGNVFQRPDRYVHLGHWRFAVQGLATVSLTDNEGNVVATNRLYLSNFGDTFPAIVGLPSGPFSQCNVGLSPGWASQSEPQYHSGALLDITDVANGTYTFTVTFGGGDWGIPETREAVQININGFDIRYPHLLSK